jgi:hypothetical protein
MPRTEIGISQIVQLAISATYVGTSAYLSYTLEDCNCDHGRVFVPNQFVMIIGVLGIAFTLCSCCFDSLEFGHYYNTVVPAIVAGVCTIVMATGKDKCDSKCKDLNFSNPAIRFQLGASVLLLIWGLIAYTSQDKSPYKKKASPKKRTQAEWQAALLLDAAGKA